MKHQIKITCKFAGLINKNKKSSEKSLLFAERGGFEPPKPFWGLLAFQAGQFNHSCISPFARTKIAFFAKFHNKMGMSLKKMLNL